MLFEPLHPTANAAGRAVNWWMAEDQPLWATVSARRGQWMVVHHEDVLANAEAALSPVLANWQREPRADVDWEKVSRTSKGGRGSSEP